MFSRSFYCIAREFNVSPSVVKVACRNYSRFGVISMFKSKGQPRDYPPAIENWIVDKKTLDQQKFLSLKQRCVILWDKFGLHISPHGLNNLYKRHGIGYKIPRRQTRKTIAKGPAHKAE